MKRMTTMSKIRPALSPRQLKRQETEEWKVSVNHPKITPQLRESLLRSFERLASLNARALASKLPQAEQLEQGILALLHHNFRYGVGEWAPFIGIKYFDRRYTPKN